MAVLSLPPSILYPRLYFHGCIARCSSQPQTLCRIVIFCRRQVVGINVRMDGPLLRTCAVRTNPGHCRLKSSNAACPWASVDPSAETVQYSVSKNSEVEIKVAVGVFRFDTFGTP